MSEFSDCWPAPAKLNLMLKVVGRRANGYHELQTVFQFVDLQDRISFRVSDSGQVTRSNPLKDVPEAKDLSVRAAKLLKQHSGCANGVDIAIEKKIPLGGGLGGGSSNAATVLLALNTLWHLGLSIDQLAQLGLTLGADVPVFVRGYAAWAEGVGEHLSPIDLPEPNYLIVKPPCSVATAEIFADQHLTRDAKKITIPCFLAGDHENGLRPVVERLYPEVADALNWLSHFGESRLTGSGACIFIANADRQPLESALADLPSGYSGWIAKGLNRSPVLDRLTSR